MHKQKNPLMLAYIIFLIIALVYYAVAYIFHFEFHSWESIIVAATIASYAFSLSSISKCLLKQNQQYSELLNRYLELSKKQQKIENTVLSDCENKEKILQNGKEIIDNTIKLISLTDKEVRKNERISFLLDVGGYLVFFCIICFNTLCNVFCPIQDVFTLLAFVIILIVEYIEKVITTKYEEIFNILIKNTQDTIQHLEDENNG